MNPVLEIPVSLPWDSAVGEVLNLFIKTQRSHNTLTKMYRNAVYSYCLTVSPI